MNIKDEHKELPWIVAKDSPWGIDLLDLRPISQTMLSTSKDPRMAENAVSYSNEDGSSFWGQVPQSSRRVEVSLSYSILGQLYPGVLFFPDTMDHKWAIYFDGKLIYFIRSWRREVFAIAETRQMDNKLIIDTIQGYFVDDDEEPTFTEAVAHYLILSHALNELAPVPLDNTLKEDTYTAGLWAFSLCGTKGIVGVFDNTIRIAPQKALCTHSLLHLAIARNNIEAIEHYLAQGYDINAQAGDGLTTLHWALTPSTLTYLLQRGANPDVPSREGATPIMNAVQANNMEQLTILLDAGANVNAQDYRGFTALHRASEMGKAQLVRLLLDRGADKAIEAEGYTALSLAEIVKNKEIIEILKK